MTAYQLFSDKNLSILFYNARSLLPRFDELCTFCENNCPGVVCVVETWLGEEITDSEISLPDYQLYRLDRNRHGGGVLMYVHNNYSCKVLLTGPAQLEFLLISIYRNCHRINVGTFYRPPNSSVSVMDHLFSVLESLDSSYFSNFVLLGGFNIDFCNPNLPLYSKLTSLMQLFSQTQVVQGTTHSSTGGKESLLDIALVSTPKKLKLYSLFLTLTIMVSSLNGVGSFHPTMLKQLHEQYGSTLMQTLRKLTSCWLTLIGKSCWTPLM